MNRIVTTDARQPEPTAREQELLHKLGDRGLALVFVSFIAVLELLVIFQLTHPGSHFTS